MRLRGLAGGAGHAEIELFAAQLQQLFLQVGAGLGVILSAVYMLSMFQKVYLGEVTHAKNQKLPDLQPREWASVVPLCAMAIFMGVFPAVFLRPMEPSVRKIVERVQSVRPVRVEVPRAQGRPLAAVQVDAMPVAGR